MATTAQNRVPIGLQLSAWERMTSFDRVLEIAKMADDLGYANLTLSESFGRDGVVIADRLLAATSGISVCFGLANPFSRSPGVLASASATLDEMSGGRFILALGTSTSNLIQGWHGMAFDRPLQRMRETIEMCHRIWDRDKAPYEGEIFQAGGVRMTFEPPNGHIPIWSGSLLERSLELTGEVFDGWIPGLMPFEHVAWGLERIDAGLARSGRDRTAIEVAPTSSIVLDNDGSRSAMAEKFGIAMYYGSANSPYAKAASAVGYADDVAEIQQAYSNGGAKEAAAAVSDRLLASVAIVGSTLGECRDQMAQRLSQGVDRIVVGLPGNTREECEPVLRGLLPTG